MRCFRVLLALCLPLLFAACAAGGPTTAPLPRYGIGDSYRFDDGITRSVAGSAGDTVYWRVNRGDSLVTTRDVLLPPVQERTPGMQVRYRLDEDPGLFPLVPGKRIAFDGVAEWIMAGQRRPNRSEEHWRCHVRGTRSVDTPAGTFHTIRVDCTMQQSGSAQILHRTFYYAPAIGFYVRREDRAGDGAPHRVNLIAYSAGNPALPDTALRQRITAMQLALERHVSGDPVMWRDPLSNASGSIDPVLTVRSRRYGWCREFRERMLVAERRYDLTGTACRDRTGTWQVREITPFRTASR